MHHWSNMSHIRTWWGQTTWNHVCWREWYVLLMWNKLWLYGTRYLFIHRHQTRTHAMAPASAKWKNIRKADEIGLLHPARPHRRSIPWFSYMMQWLWAYNDKADVWVSPLCRKARWGGYWFDYGRKLVLHTSSSRTRTTSHATHASVFDVPWH